MNAHAKKAQELKKKIASGKLKGIALVRAKRFYSWSKWKAKQKPSKSTKKVSKAVKKARKQVFNPSQGFLPSFLSQVNMVRIEELVAERMFNALAEGLKVTPSNVKKVIGE